MDDILKIKVSVEDVSIELEGEGSLVDSILKNLIDEGINKIRRKVLKETNADCSQYNMDPEPVFAQEVESKDSEIQANDYPLIKDIMIKDLPKTETEWILVYSFYASCFGTKEFTKNSIKEGYESTSRFTSARKKNFVTNLKNAITNGWFKSVNEDSFILLPSGISTAKEIINRSSNDKVSKKTKQNTSKRLNYQLVDLGLTDKERESFKTYFNSFSNLSNVDKAVICVYWISTLPNKTTSEVDSNVVFSALRIANAKTTFDIGSALNNGKNRNNYFVSGSSTNKYVLNHIGVDHAKELENKRIITDD